MNLEQQVVYLELAQKMKELGFKQDSLWYWNEKTKRITRNNRRFEYVSYLDEGSNDIESKHYIDNIHAYTVAELGEMLPAGYCQTDTVDEKHYPDLKRYAVFYAGAKNMEKDSNEANARAKMLIWLKENKYI